MGKNVHPQTIREKLAEGASQLRSECDGMSDALTYRAELISDTLSDLGIDQDECLMSEQELRDEATRYIKSAYGAA